MVKNLISFFVSVLLSIHVSIAQKSSCNINTVYPQYMTIDRFDIQFYNEHKEENSTLTKKGENGEIIFYTSISNRYFVKKSSDYNPYFETFTYDKKGNLTMRESHFYECKIGKQLLFDSMGNSREGIDYDEPFKLSVEEVAALIKEKYDIDILEKGAENNKLSPTNNSVSLTRLPYEPTIQKPYYSFTLSSMITRSNTTVLIDGTTGDILIEDIQPLQVEDIFHYKNIIQKYAEKQALS